jgi:hypothetical protein
LAAGLLDAGIDRRTADMIVGTSAGSVVGAQLVLSAVTGGGWFMVNDEVWARAWGGPLKLWQALPSRRNDSSLR